MRSRTTTIRVPSALVDSLPGRVAMLRSEIGYMSTNAYFTGLIRSDLAAPPAVIPVGMMLVRSALFEQDVFDDDLLKRWASGSEQARLERRARRAA